MLWLLRLQQIRGRQAVWGRLLLLRQRRLWQ
jgi:hypothetical protein